jgi:hypothetical protein
MEVLWLAIYILICPAIGVGVLAMIWVAVLREKRAARSGGEDMV